MILTDTVTQKTEVKELLGFKYIEEGEGKPLILLHGLFGTLCNWENVVSHFSVNYKVIAPFLPIYDSNLREATLDSLLSYLENFIKLKKLEKVTLVGNSLGGQVALMYTLKHQEKVERLVLSGSSGLYENVMGRTYPKRGDYEFVKEKVKHTFYKTEVATKELIDEVFEVTQSIPKSLRIVSLARSAQRNNLSAELHKIKIPTLLIWGINDTITPPETAQQFKKLIPHSFIRFIDECGHVPMMEQPAYFNRYLEDFLKR